MKFTSQLFAFALVGVANAFVLKGPKVASNVFVKSTYESLNTGVGEEFSAISGGLATRSSQFADMQFARNIEELEIARVQGGGSLRTWSFQSQEVERVMVALTGEDRTLDTMTHEGRLLHARVYLCQGPDNTPVRMEVKSDKGKYRPFKCVIETPGGHSSLFVRNIGNIEFPITASVGAATEDPSIAAALGFMELSSGLYDMSTPRILQGGAVVTYPLEPAVSAAKVVLKTDGRPMNASIELVQGPNSIKMVIDLYTEDGLERPAFLLIPTPGPGNVIRIVNTAPVEFPLIACVDPYMIEAV